MFQNGLGKKISKYLMWIVIGQIILTGLLFGIDVNRYTLSYQKDIVEKNLNNQVQLVNEWLKIQEKTMRQYSDMLSMVSVSSDKERIRETVESLCTQEADFYQVYYTSTEGENILSGTATPRVDGRQRQWYKGALVRELYVSQPYIDVISGEHVVTISKAIYSPTGTLQGVLGADLKLNDLLNKIHMVDASMVSAIMLTDLNQKILFYESFNEADRETFQTERYETIHRAMDKRYTPISIQMKDMNTQLTVFLKKGQFLVTLIQGNYDVWIAIFTGLTGILITLTYVGRVMSEPIRILTSNVRQIAKQEGDGNISRENSERDLSEIYQLFKQLDQHIRQNIRAIYVMNDNMREANEILEQKNKEFQESLVSLQKINEDLKASERIYQNLIDNIDEVIWVSDLEGQVIYANDKLTKWLNMTSGEVMRLTLKDFVEDLSHANEFEGIGFFTSRDFSDLDFCLSHKNAKKDMDLLVHTTVIYFKGEAVSVQFIGRDVTEEKRLYRQYYQKNREMMIMNDISRSLTTKDDLGSILQHITDRISNLLDVSGVSIRMIDSEGFLALKAVSGTLQGNLYPEKISAIDTQMAQALSQEKMISILSVADLNQKDDLLQKIIDSQKAVYYFPLYNRDMRFGVLTVISERPLEADRLVLLKSLSENASTAIEKASLFEKLRFNYLKTIEALSNALEEKVFNYKNHTKRVAEFSKLIAERFYLSQRDLDDIYISGLLHDIGKLGIADDLLRHEDDLSEEDMKEMLKHVEIGQKILEPIGLNPQILEGIYLHHKNFDLSGHPPQIALDKLPLFARIIGVADAFDTMLIHARTQADWKLDMVYNQLELDRDTLYCPEVLGALRELIELKREQVFRISEL